MPAACRVQEPRPTRFRVATPVGLASEAALQKTIDKSVVETPFIDSID
jgi:hypothetical protein